MKTKSNQSPILDTSSITLASLMGLTLLSGLILSSSLASAGTDATDEITITVPTSCSMSSTGTNSHVAELGNGQSNSTIGETTITTYCNDNEGFAIYAIGYTGDTLGNTVLTDTSLGSTHDIVTGTATSGNTSNWAMKLSTISSPAPNFPIIISGTTSDTLKEQGDPDYSTFQAVPDDYTKVAYRTSSTDVGTNAEGSIFKTTYQAYISPTQSAGTYQGKVKYVLIYPHNGDAPTIPTAFTWQSSSATRPADADVTMMMQDFTAAMCNAGQDGQIGWVKDSRDNKVYTIAKLADGKCWMTENLDLAGGTALSADDTDVTSAYISDFTTSNNLTKAGDTIVLPASSEQGFDTDDYSYVYNSLNASCDGHSACYSYYSWDATTLGSGRSISTDNTDAPQSICPKGWRLPTSRWSDTFDATLAIESDFYNFATSYGMPIGSWEGSTENQAGAGSLPNLVFTGYYLYDSFNDEDGRTFGTYWSSSHGDYAPYSLFYATYGFHTSDAHISDFAGKAIRCVAR